MRVLCDVQMCYKMQLKICGENAVTLRNANNAVADAGISIIHFGKYVSINSNDPGK